MSIETMPNPEMAKKLHFDGEEILSDDGKTVEGVWGYLKGTEILVPMMLKAGEKQLSEAEKKRQAEVNAEAEKKKFVRRVTEENLAKGLTPEGRNTDKL
jgi:hypothetical protein